MVRRGWCRALIFARACQPCWWVVSECRRLCQRAVEGQGAELRIGQEMVSEREEDSQGSIWGLSTSGTDGQVG